MSPFKLGLRLKTKALFAHRHVLRAGVAYLYDPPARPDRVPVIWEFQRVGHNRWECVGLGRHDQPQYAGMFPA